MEDSEDTPLNVPLPNTAADRSDSYGSVNPANADSHHHHPRPSKRRPQLTGRETDVFYGTACDCLRHNLRLILIVLAFVVFLGLLFVSALLARPRYYPSTNPYTFTVKRLNQGNPLTLNSTFTYNYNAAYFPVYGGGDGLAVRVQNLIANASSPYDVGPSSIAFTESTNDLLYTPLNGSTVILSPSDDPKFLDANGVEDPRVVFDSYSNTYFMMYTAVQTVGNETTARLSMATSGTKPGDPQSWTKHGPVFPSLGWSKSGALLLRPSAPSPTSYLFWGDSSIWVATTNDNPASTSATTGGGLQWEDRNSVLLSTRINQWDSELVEAGPPPLRLADGNFLFLYNSARVCLNCSNEKPGWHLEYNLGYVVLDKNDPTVVLYRSSVPLLTPTQSWEKCTSGGTKALTPWVVFVEGWKEIAENRFLIWYQGCDSQLGLAEIDVTSRRDE